MFDKEKLEWCGSLTVRKFDDMFSSFDTIPACDGQTDRQHSPRYAYASRSKNR